MNSSTAAQLDLIREIAGALDAGSIEWWLFGGWAMDFHAGRVTRDHSDIEIFSWKHDATAVSLALTAADFVHAIGGLYPEECQTFLMHGQEIGVWFIERDAGTIFTPGRWSGWPWIDGAFNSDPLTIDDVTARCMSIEGLLDMKTRFAAHPHGAPLRDKDIADIALLRSLLTAQGS